MGSAVEIRPPRAYAVSTYARANIRISHYSSRQRSGWGVWRSSLHASSSSVYKRRTVSQVPDVVENRLLNVAISMNGGRWHRGQTKRLQTLLTFWIQREPRHCITGSCAGRASTPPSSLGEPRWFILRQLLRKMLKYSRNSWKWQSAHNNTRWFFASL